MQCTEGSIDQIRIVGRAVEIEQRCFQLSQEFLGFLLEYLYWICRGHSPRTFLATATSCSG